MRLLLKILSALRRLRPARPGGYGAEVLFAGWVELPPAFRELPRPAGPRKPTFT